MLSLRARLNEAWEQFSQLQEVVRYLEQYCSADDRERARQDYIARNGMEPPNLTIEEVLGSYGCKKIKLGSFSR